jgi:hypothetical protein
MQGHTLRTRELTDVVYWVGVWVVVRVRVGVGVGVHTMEVSSLMHKKIQDKELSLHQINVVGS